MNNTNAEVGQRIQEKFQFYVLGLIFALLGLAIQTAEFGVSAVADIMELAGWIALLVSALVLMSRLEWIPQIYHLFDVQQEIEDKKWCQILNCELHFSLFTIQDLTPVPDTGTNSRFDTGTFTG